MFPRVSLSLPLPTVRSLLDYHADHESGVDPADLADQAIREWLQRQHDLERPAGRRGYLWKTVFLPDGARLRISTHHGAHHAEIVGDELVCNAMSMSPNQFVKAALGQVRNAWEAIYVQMPGERQWKHATRLRYEAAAQARRAQNRDATASAAAEARPAPLQQRLAAPGLQDGKVLVPQLRPDRAERRCTYRRAEDLLLD